jgi:hypothetical protein
MNKKLLPALTFGVAMLLVGTLAYAAERRKTGRTGNQPDDRVKEEETLRSELLDLSAPTLKKSVVGDDGKKSATQPLNDKSVAISARLDKK